MKDNKRILDLSLTYHWYDMIASGEKKEEYREIKDFYFKRLNMEYRLNLELGCYEGCDEFIYNPIQCIGCKKFVSYPYEAVRFHRGQGGKNTMLVEFKGVHIGYGEHPEWGAPHDKPVFIIELGKVLEKS